MLIQKQMNRQTYTPQTNMDGITKAFCERLDHLFIKEFEASSKVAVIYRYFKTLVFKSRIHEKTFWHIKHN